MDDKDLIEGLKKQRTKALDELIDNYSMLVYGVIKNILFLSHELEYTEECYNDTLLTIWYNIDKFDENKGIFKNWIISVAKYKAIDYKRKSNKKYREENIDQINIKDETYIDEIVIGNDELQKLNSAIEKLDELDRRIFKMRFQNELDIDEIAINLNLTKSTIYTRISRGKSKLKKLMEVEYE